MRLDKSESSKLIIMSAEEARNICLLGRGDECCAFVAVYGREYACIRKEEAGQRVLLQGSPFKGRGEWEGCHMVAALNITVENKGLLNLHHALNPLTGGAVDPVISNSQFSQDCLSRSSTM